MSGRKIPRSVDNPIDNLLVDLVEKLNPYFKKLNFTPNMITTLSLIFGILMNGSYFKNNYNMAAASLLVSYFFDCMDGNYARKYNMQSKFGDLYDHFKDWIIIIVFFILFMQKKLPISFKIISFVCIIIVLLGTYIHVGCTEKYIKKYQTKTKTKNSEALESITHCPNLKYLNLTKYFGCGTFNLLLILIIILHNYIDILYIK